jgi:hypothetical protein
MPRHVFKFPREVVNAIKTHVRKAVEGVDPNRYKQEPQYTTALISKLEGTAYKGEHGSVVFQSTAINDRGPGSAEYKYGADFAITATISDGYTTIKKAILVQAKLGKVEKLSPAKKSELKDQIKKMQQLVDAPKVLEIPEESGRRNPAMISGNRILKDETFTPMELPEYFVARVSTTLDGCTDKKIVETVQHSSLPRVNVTADLEHHDRPITEDQS